MGILLDVLSAIIDYLRLLKNVVEAQQIEINHELKIGKNRYF